MHKTVDPFQIARTWKGPVCSGWCRLSSRFYYSRMRIANDTSLQCCCWTAECARHTETRNCDSHLQGRW